jgi:hypothetical protein
LRLGKFSAAGVPGEGAEIGKEGGDSDGHQAAFP